MSIRIGKVELAGVQDVYTEESHNLVEQRVPDQQGSVFQDLGREPLTLILEGLLFGSDVLPDLEKLRQAQEKADPLPMAADIAVGTELTDVIIEDLKVRQVAGYASRYRFYLRLREYIEPPQSQAQADAAVDDAVAADADNWAEDSMAASAVLENPAHLSGALAENPELLDHMNADDLAGALADNVDSLSADDLGGTFKAVGALDPDKMGGMLTGLKEKGALGGLMEKFAAAGKSLKEILSGIDLQGIVKGMVALFTVGTELIGLLKEVWKDMQDVWKNMSGQNIMSGLEAFLKTAVEELEKLIRAITKLVQSLNKVVIAFKPQKEGDPSPITALKDLNCGTVVIKILTPVIETLRKIEDALAWIGAQVIQLAGVSALLGTMRPVLAGGVRLIEDIGDQAMTIGAADKEGMGGLKSSVSSAGSSFYNVLEKGQTTLDSLLETGESLLGSDLDSTIFPLKQAFGELRVNITAFKREFERPSGGESQLQPSTMQQATAEGRPKQIEEKNDAN
ncbi:MAG: hypothetical protein OEV42_04615 [Deltaproteobacteria bacterium]|nr:hypothetical protein [Deltaproteobacteria bacterium]